MNKIEDVERFLIDTETQFNKDKGGLLATTLPSGTKTKLPRLPIEMGDYDLGLRNDPPRIGADSEALVSELGYSANRIAELVEKKLLVI
jgi:crotonobetainyl-CoA:carnitine CoA-transferase CaiB-like acyl-CoA transferase